MQKKSRRKPGTIPEKVPEPLRDKLSVEQTKDEVDSLLSGLPENTKGKTDETPEELKKEAPKRGQSLPARPAFTPPPPEEDKEAPPVEKSLLRARKVPDTLPQVAPPGAPSAEEEEKKSLPKRITPVGPFSSWGPYILIALLVIATIIAYIVYPVAGFLLLTTFLQVYGRKVIPKLKLDKIPYFNWDEEITRLLVIFGARSYGLFIAFIVISWTLLLHFVFHLETKDSGGILDYYLRFFLDALIVYIVQAPLLVLIPWVVLASKFFRYIYSRALGGAPPLDPGLRGEIMVVLEYFAFFNIVYFFLRLVWGISL